MTEDKNLVIVDNREIQNMIYTIRGKQDEFQDTDGLQYAIFSTLFRDLHLFLIGDPKQAIYSFRGADLHTYLQTRKS